MVAACVSVRALAEDASAKIDPRSFATFAEQQINDSISRNEFPGAAIVLVQDGTITFSRGYGVADLRSRQPVDPMTTGFRVGSISKLITVVAALQLVERGKLSLTDEIQSRLPDVPLADAGAGVTIHSLLTHTDGFEVGWSIGGAVRDEHDAVSLATFLQTHVPRRILPPGQMYVYSDVGMALAGHIVENVDGRPFAKYAREKILDPLGMTRSTFDQPLPNPFATNLATGYRKFKGEYHAMPTEHVLAYPAAGFTTTAGDMARFMIACLGDGEIDGHRVLSADMVARMKEPQFSHHPALPGTCYGFYERLKNGQRALQHQGVMPGYHGLVLLLPQHHTGIFVAANAYADQDFEPFIDAFFDRFFPNPTTQPTIAPASSETIAHEPADLSGRYRYVQYPHFSIAKLSILAGMVEEMRIRQQPDGKVIVDQGLKGPWTCAGALLYERGEEKLAFRLDDHGRTIGAVYDTWAFQKIHWYESAHAQMALIALLALTFMLAAVARITTALVRGCANGPYRARTFAAGACAIDLVFLLGLSYALWGTDAFLWYYGLPKLVVALTYLPWLGMAMTLIAIIFTIREISARDWRLPWKCAHGIVLVALLIFPAFCWYWNLLAWPG